MRFCYTKLYFDKLAGKHAVLLNKHESIGRESGRGSFPELPVSGNS
jgi:hypothetical protein